MKPARTLARIAFAAALVAAPVLGAEAMVDPTRPPLSVSAPEGGPATGLGPVLQSILITPHRRSAIIDGERVDLRGRFDDAEVVQITETEVVLRSPGGTEILKMYPGVEKAVKRTDARPAVAAERNRGR